jgi:hypothetical protein
MTHLFVTTFFNNCTTHASKTMTMLHYRITAIMKVETDIITSSTSLYTCDNVCRHLQN